MIELARGQETKTRRGETTGIARSVRKTTGFNEIAKLFKMQERSVALFPLKPIRQWLLRMDAKTRCKLKVPDNTQLTLSALFSLVLNHQFTPGQNLWPLRWLKTTRTDLKVCFRNIRGGQQLEGRSAFCYDWRLKTVRLIQQCWSGKCLSVSLLQSVISQQPISKTLHTLLECDMRAAESIAKIFRVKVTPHSKTCG